MSDIIERSQTHATFVIERTYPAPVEAVWHALSDNDARDQWFSAGSAFDAREIEDGLGSGRRGVERVAGLRARREGHGRELVADLRRCGRCPRRE